MTDPSTLNARSPGGDTGGRTPPAQRGFPVWFILAYVAVVLAVDTSAAFAANGKRVFGAPIPYEFLFFCWRTRSGFDLFKFVFWFLVPVLWSLPSLDWGYLGLARWRRLDLVLFPAFIVVGVASLALIPYVPSLRETYRGMGYSGADAYRQVWWTVSWLTGWEFLHRYALLRSVAARWPRFGWILVPVSEGLYHLQKPPLEALGMVLFSIVACRWCLSRKNILLPFGVHLAIELGLVGYLLLAS